MYILQFCNAFTKEVIRQETYHKPDKIEKVIESFNDESYFDSFLVDRQWRILRANYITYKAYPDGNDMIYKLFFRVQAVEATIKR